MKSKKHIDYLWRRCKQKTAKLLEKESAVSYSIALKNGIRRCIDRDGRELKGIKVSCCFLLAFNHMSRYLIATKRKYISNDFIIKSIKLSQKTFKYFAFVSRQN